MKEIFITIWALTILIWYGIKKAWRDLWAGVFYLIFLLLLSGCMTCFDHRIERAHREYLSFQSAHQAEFGQQAKRNDWEVGFWWDYYQLDRTNRGKVLGPGPDADWNREPKRGIWATFSGRCMIQEIEATKQSWRKNQ